MSLLTSFISNSSNERARGGTAWGGQEKGQAWRTTENTTTMITFNGKIVMDFRHSRGSYVSFLHTVSKLSKPDLESDDELLLIILIRCLEEYSPDLFFIKGQRETAAVARFCTPATQPTAS